MSRSGRAWACAIAVAIAALLVLLPSTNGRGPEMDEGAVVSYAARVLDGAVPQRDFSTLYGPANPWLVAIAFETFERNVGTERAVGLLYRLAIVLALFVLARILGGLAGAVLAGLVAAAIMSVELIWAYATYGAMAAALVGTALAATAARTDRLKRQNALLCAAGVAAGLATLMRLDFAPAALIAALPLLGLVSRRGRLWYGAGFAATAALLLVHLALVGPERIARAVTDLRATGPGRSLPIPSPGTVPGNLLAAGLLAAALLTVLGAILWRRDARDVSARVLVSVGIFSLAILPWSLSRADELHVRPFALLSLSLVPAVVLLLARLLDAGARTRAVVVGVLAVLTLFIVPDPGGYADLRAISRLDDSYRGFYDGADDPARAVVVRAQRLARPGDSLFVGPQDLRRTNYGPTYMYFLLRELRPASYYMEMNPMNANRADSGLADELREADWLILTSAWDDWDEPNASAKYGSSEPNDVVRTAFCVRLESGQYRLYERCDRGGDQA